MGFFSSRIELNNTIKSLESEIEKLKIETTDKSEKIAKLKEQISSLSQKNAEYEKTYINTGIECEFCYTVLRNGFVFCPKCGKKIEKVHSQVKVYNEDVFVTEPDGDGCLITQYNGFDEKVIVIPSQIKGKKVIGIAHEVFRNCRNLEEVIFENGCVYIGNKVFYCCGKLRNIKLPKSLKEIGSNAFSRTALEEVVLPPNLIAIGDGVFSSCEKLKNVIISESLRVIPSFAFWGSAIEKIHIPENIIAIGSNAFEKTLLQEVEFPKNLKAIKQGAFKNCSLMKKMTIHSNATEIEHMLYADFSTKIPATICCAAGSEAQKYAREHYLDMVQIDSVPKPKNSDKIVSSILITFFDCIINSRSGISQEYFPTWLKNVVGGYNISQWHWNSGKSNWGMQVYTNKPYSFLEAQEIKRKIENRSHNMSIEIKIKIYGE